MTFIRCVETLKISECESWYPIRFVTSMCMSCLRILIFSTVGRTEKRLRGNPERLKQKTFLLPCLHCHHLGTLRMSLSTAGVQPLQHYRQPLGNTDSPMITIYCFHWCQRVNVSMTFMSTASRFKVEFPSCNGSVMS